MSYFKTPKQTLQDRRRESPIIRTRKDAIKVKKEVALKNIAPFMKYMYSINIGIMDRNLPDNWNDIVLFHEMCWRRPNNVYDVNNQSFVYHVGLENVAKYIQLLIADEENHFPVIQRLLLLQFGQEEPDPLREYNYVLGYPENIEGFSRWHPRTKNAVESMKEAVKNLQNTIAVSMSEEYKEEQQKLLYMRNIYMNNSIAIMSDLIGYLELSNSDLEWAIPDTFIDGKKRSIGNVFDDYLTSLTHS